jgi:hypothetical protein
MRARRLDPLPDRPCDRFSAPALQKRQRSRLRAMGPRDHVARGGSGRHARGSSGDPPWPRRAYQDFRSAPFLGTRAIDAARLSSVRLAGASAWMSSIGGGGAEIGFSHGRTPCALRWDRPEQLRIHRLRCMGPKRAWLTSASPTMQPAYSSGSTRHSPWRIPGRLTVGGIRQMPRRHRLVSLNGRGWCSCGSTLRR